MKLGQNIEMAETEEAEQSGAASGLRSKKKTVQLEENKNINETNETEEGQEISPKEETNKKDRNPLLN